MFFQIRSQSQVLGTDISFEKGSFQLTDSEIPEVSGMRFNFSFIHSVILVLYLLCVRRCSRGWEYSSAISALCGVSILGVIG